MGTRNLDPSRPSTIQRATPQHWRAPAAREQARASRRTRIILAAVCLACERGASSASVTEVARLAGVSRRTFYEFFEDRDSCLLAAVDYALTHASESARAAYDAHARWPDRVRAGLTALLQFFDDQPQLARMCVMESAAAGPAALARRREVLDALVHVIDGGSAPARPVPALMAEIVVGGSLSVISAHMLEPEPGPLLDLANPLMSMIMLPYRGGVAARKELARPRPVRTAAPPRKINPNPFEGLRMRMTHRTVAVLLTISAEPGLSNLELSKRAGIRDQGQISRLLARLSHLGLIENTGGGASMGTTNAWRLTLKGAQVDKMIAQGFPTEAWGAKAAHATGTESVELGF